MRDLVRAFRISATMSVVGVLAATIVAGPRVGLVVAVLAILEISLSFDNAVVNAKVLARMDAKWQRLFLTVGIVIAVFGMRLVFPLVVVGLAGHLGPVDVVKLALHHPHEYAETLNSAHPAIATFGGLFLLMIFLDFVLQEREITWLSRIEERIAKAGQLRAISPLVGLVTLLVVTPTLGSGHEQQVLFSGVAGLATYLAVTAFSDVAGVDGVGAGLVGFVYLQLLDASFSFDGVIGAFAITDKIFEIALGLGIGALWVRSATVYLVKRGTLASYVYLEHGAHYAIGALAVLLLVTIQHEIPELVTGGLGLGIIGLALGSSIRYRRAHPVLPAS